MTPEFWLPLALSGLVVGLLIGSVGVGGVLLVPLLTVAFGIDVRVAIATCLFAYVFSGVASTLLYARRGSIPWRPAAWMVAGGIPGAAAGAVAVVAAPVALLKGLIAALMIGAGLQVLGRHGKGRALPQADRRGAGMAVLGAAVAFGSALTGTGGAVILVPVLLAAGFPALFAVGLGQVMQLPVSLAATAHNLAIGTIDLAVGSLLAGTLVAGIAAGVRVAHAAPAEVLRRAVAAMLLLFGALMAAQALAG